MIEVSHKSNHRFVCGGVPAGGPRHSGTAELHTWKRTPSLAAFGLLLAMALISAGCNPASKQNAQQIEALEAKVAQLESRLNEMQRPPLTPEQQEGRERMQARRGQYNQRYGLDVRTHSQVKAVEVENAYQATQRNWNSPEAIEARKKFVKKYPGFNRTGCALCELGQLTSGPECEPYLKECIQKYDDCYWGDGVQVGPLARYFLANYYKGAGQNDKAEALYKEIKDNYPDSIDHSGQPLVDVINKQ
jgi:hypothetical protein